MSPATHFLTGWVLATAADLNRRERAIITMAAVIPDVDGLGVIPELLTGHSQHPLAWFSRYHHGLHTLLFAIVVAFSAYLIAGRRWSTAALAFLAFHLHLLEDILGSRGPDGYGWPIPYLSPLTTAWTWSWEGQWGLNAWPNIAITAALCCLTIWMAVRRGYSPVDLFSPNADKSVIDVLRKRFGSAGVTI